MTADSIHASSRNERAELHPPMVMLREVSRIYRTEGAEVRAVDQVNLSIARSAFVAIMGASGSGKSTLMNILGCLDQPTSGQYWLNGAEIGTLDRHALATVRNQHLGFVFQSFNLLSRTSALENVELPLLYATPPPPIRERRERAMAALRQVRLQDRAGHLPSQLSGGQQQRVAIARALVNRPEMLLADEPTGNLDSRTSVEIMALLQELNGAGLTVVMVTHEVDIAAFCGRVLFMRDGRVIRDELQTHAQDAKSALAELSRDDSAAPR